MLTEQRTRRAILVTIAILILVLGVGIVGPEPTGARALFALLVVLPLCAFIPLLARGHRRSYAALTLCLAAYLTFTLMEVVANPGARIWAGLALLMSFGLFSLLIVYLRVTRVH